MSYKKISYIDHLKKEPEGSITIVGMDHINNLTRISPDKFPESVLKEKLANHENWLTGQQALLKELEQ